jgi:spore coat protein CotH
MFLLLGCTQIATVGSVTFEDSSRDEHDSDPALEDSAPEEPDEQKVFQLDHVVQIEVELSEEALASLATDPYTYVEGDLRIDDVDYPSVGVRIKGRLGSYRAMPAKSALKIDFKEFGGPEGPDDLEKLNLNNMVQDCAQAHEQASYGLHELAGIPSPRVAYGWVRINGANYGLYSLVDVYDDEFLKRRFEDPSGNLYDGDYVLWADGSYSLVDFTDAAQHLFILDEGEDVGLADIQAVTHKANGGLDDLEPVVDIERLGAFIGLSAWTGQYDSYAYYSNNYRVYFDPARDGRMVFLPWDPDWAFHANTPVNSPYSRLAQLCLDDAGCRGHARDAAQLVTDSIPGSTFEADIHKALELTEDYVEDDRKREVTVREIEGCREDMLDWFSERQGQLDERGF